MSPSFAQLGVPTAICDALARHGITEPFEIQAATIADALDGRDVCGRAPTGSGKTLAFGIPLVVTVERARPHRPRALVLAPTRELAHQISVELRNFAGKTRIGVVYGGVGYGPQLKSLRAGIDILVACPGRLEDLIEQGSVDLSDVDRVVLDEADRMADMGFMPSVRRLLDQTSRDRQTVLFSATLDGDVAKLTRDYQRDPVRHEVGAKTPDIKAAQHVFWRVGRDNRTDVTAEAVNAVWPAIIFCRTRHGSDRLAKRLAKSGIKAAAIHGGRSQGQRTRALDDFARGRVHALVATDVAARGIHVDGVESVIHFDPPEDEKAYVHRSGRTARAGESGLVVSLVQSDQMKDTRKLQRKVGLDEPVTEPDAAALREMSGGPRRQLTPSDAYDDRDRTETARPRRNRPSGSGGPRNRSGANGSRSRQHGSKANGQRTSRPHPSGDDSQPRSGSKPGARSADGTGRPKAKHNGAPKKGGKPKPKNRSGQGAGGSSNGTNGSKPKHKSQSGARAAQAFATKQGRKAKGSSGPRSTKSGTKAAAAKY